jgi:hypothetical protein
MNDNKRNQAFDTINEKYGDKNYWRKQGLLKSKIKFFNKIKTWNEYVIPMFTLDEYHCQEETYLWKCTKCGNTFESSIYTTGLGKNRQIPRCEICFPNQATSIAEKELADFVKSIYHNEVLTNDRTLLKQYELDVVLP